MHGPSTTVLCTVHPECKHTSCEYEGTAVRHLGMSSSPSHTFPSNQLQYTAASNTCPCVNSVKYCKFWCIYHTLSHITVKCILFFFKSSSEICFSLILESRRERKRNIDCLPHPCTSTRDQTCYLVMCPDQEQKLRP